MSAADPTPIVKFRDDSTVVYAVPANTCDPRWKACTKHQVACDCREAERQEDISEYRAQLREVAQVAAEVLAGHDIQGDDGRPCMCTGCQIVRRAFISMYGVQQPEAITIRDAAGRSLVVEQLDDGRVGAWIADRGDNDGVSVVLDADACQRVARFVTGVPAAEAVAA